MLDVFLNYNSNSKAALLGWDHLTNLAMEEYFICLPSRSLELLKHRHMAFTNRKTSVCGFLVRHLPPSSSPQLSHFPSLYASMAKEVCPNGCTWVEYSIWRIFPPQADYITYAPQCDRYWLGMKIFPHLWFQRCRGGSNQVDVVPFLVIAIVS